MGVCQQDLSWLTDEAARDEGFACSGQFEAAWAGIHGSYDGAARVWRVELRVATVTALVPHSTLICRRSPSYTQHL
jgi:hypothetical protein